jgi:hypothetical protein
MIKDFKESLKERSRVVRFAAPTTRPRAAEAEQSAKTLIKDFKEALEGELGREITIEIAIHNSPSPSSKREAVETAFRLKEMIGEIEEDVKIERCQGVNADWFVVQNQCTGNRAVVFFERERD